MKTTVKDLSNTKKKLTIDVSAEEVDQAYAAATRKIGAKANIKGFRKGKIPPAVLEKHYLSDIVMETLNQVINNSYPKALQDNNLNPVLDPKFDLKPIEKSKPYVYEAELEVIPHFEVKDYLGIPIKKKEVKIPDEDVEASLKTMQEAKAELVPAADSAVLGKGLVATLDLDGTIDGAAFKGSLVKGYQVELGKKILFEGFEEKLVGMKKGETKKFDLALPETHQDKTVRGKTASFTAVLQAIHEKKLLPLDDEFAKDMGKESIAAVREEIRQELTKKKEYENRSDYAREALDFLLKKNPVEIPEGLLAKQLEHDKNTDKKEATKRIQTDLILQSIAASEKIQIDPKELNQRMHQMALMTGRPLQDIHQIYSDQGRLRELFYHIQLEKTVELILDKANYT